MAEGESDASFTAYSHWSRWWSQYRRTDHAATYGDFKLKGLRPPQTCPFWTGGDIHEWVCVEILPQIAAEQLFYLSEDMVRVNIRQERRRTWFTVLRPGRRATGRH